MRYVLALLFLIPLQSFAADYYWYYSSIPKTQFKSVPEVCAAATAAAASGNKSTYKFAGLNSTGTEGYCYQYSPDGKTIWGRAIATRQGNACPAGTTFSSTDGSCKPPDNPCKDLSGKEVTVARSGTAPDAFGTIVKDSKGRGSVVYPNSSCMNSCNITTSAMRCVFNPEGKYRCRGKGTYNGEQCTKGSDNTMEAGDSTSVPTPQVNQSEKNCVFSTDTSGKKVCTSEKTTEKEGQKCGTFNGEKVCVDSDASSTKDKTETGVATITKPDGSTVETRTDTNTTTKCEGAGDGKTNCTSTSTSTTTTTNKDKDGATTSTDKKCEGAKCNEKESGSTGGVSGGGSGSGDGEEEGSSPTTKEIKKPESGNFDGEVDKWDKKIQDAKTELKSNWDKIKTNFSPISNINLSNGSGTLYCGEPVNVLGKKIDMCLTKYQGQLSWIALAVMLICTIVALCIIFL